MELVARRLNLSRQELTGDAVTLAEQVGVDAFLSPAFSVSADGQVAYRAGVAAGRRQLTWGRVRGILYRIPVARGLPPVA